MQGALRLRLQRRHIAQLIVDASLQYHFLIFEFIFEGSLVPIGITFLLAAPVAAAEPAGRLWARSPLWLAQALILAYSIYDIF